MSIKQNIAVAVRSLIGYRSFSAAGEDRLIISWLRVVAGLKIREVRYCDIGANHPQYLSNTFALYKAGASGVLIEPDPVLCRKLRRARPRDIVLNVGAAFDDRRSAKLLRMSHNAFNTFLPAQAELVIKSSEAWGRSSKQKVVGEVEVPLVPTNELLAANFPDGLEFLTIDTEGCNLQILESIDLNRFRPKVICIESSDDFSAIMKNNKYEFLARTPDNVIFHNIQ